MSWVESSSGTFEKEFDGVEKIYRHISQVFKLTGREHWGLYCSCKFQFRETSSAHETENALRGAWKALRNVYPGLAVIPDGITKKIFNAGDPSLEKWTDETFIVERNKDVDGVVAEYPLKGLPSMYYFPKTAEIMFLASHWRIDGIGTCMLLDRFFALLAGESVDSMSDGGISSLRRISPSMEDAFGAPPIAESDTELENFARNYIDDHHRNALHAGGLSYRGSITTPPAKAADTTVVIDGASTTVLVNACKERGISVTSAVHAALANTVFALSPDSPERYSTVLSVNMRNYLPQPYDGKEHAVQVYVSGITPSVTRQSSFEDKAKYLTSSYKDWYSEKFFRAMKLIYQYHSDALFKPKPRPENAPPPKPPSNVLLSSLGVVDKTIRSEHGEGAQSVKVTGFRFGVSMMTRQMLLYVWTFAGKLTLSVNYNDAYHDAKAASEFLTFIRDVLQNELQIELKLEE
ncbi:hypothetical protein SCUP234_05871 [Seiridium cupressi]